MINHPTKKPIATFTTIDGNESSVYGYVFGQGTQAIYIQGGMHGGEITYWIFDRLFHELEKRELKKQVILVPIVNPFSWQQKSYFYTVGKFSMQDGKDWLWSFPGSETGSPMQRLAYQVYQTASSFDLSVDLHTSRKSVPFGIFSSDKYGRELKALGIPHNFVSTYGDSPEQFEKGIASLSYAMTMNDKRGFTLECGSHDDFNFEHIEQITDALLNLLRLEGVIDEPVLPAGDIHVFGDKEFAKYSASISGFVEYLKMPGTSFVKGEALFRILNATHLGESATVRARTDGTVLKISPTHIAQAGDIMMEVMEMY